MAILEESAQELLTKEYYKQRKRVLQAIRRANKQLGVQVDVKIPNTPYSEKRLPSQVDIEILSKIVPSFIRQKISLEFDPETGELQSINGIDLTQPIQPLQAKAEEPQIDYDTLLTEGELVEQQISSIIESYSYSDSAMTNAIIGLIEDAKRQYGEENVYYALANCDESELENLQYMLKYNPESPIGESYLSYFQNILAHGNTPYALSLEQLKQQSEQWTERIQSFQGIIPNYID